MGTIVTRRRIIWRTGAVATADGRTWRNIIWRRRPTAELIIISLHGAVATADGVAARLPRTVILAVAFFAICIGFVTLFAFDFAFAFALALAIVGACGCAAMPPTEGFVVCSFFLGPLRFAEKYSGLEAMR